MILPYKLEKFGRFEFGPVSERERVVVVQNLYNHTHSLSETVPNAKLPNFPSLFANVKTEDQPRPSTENRFVADHRTNTEIATTTYVWRKNLLFLVQVQKQHLTKEPN